MSVYAVSTHCSEAPENPRSARIAGSATATIVTSSTTMNWTEQSSVTGERLMARNGQAVRS